WATSRGSSATRSARRPPRAAAPRSGAAPTDPFPPGAPPFPPPERHGTLPSTAPGAAESAPASHPARKDTGSAMSDPEPPNAPALGSPRALRVEVYRLHGSSVRLERAPARRPGLPPEAHRCPPITFANQLGYLLSLEGPL